MRPYIVYPADIIRRALTTGLITEAEAASKAIRDGAQREAEQLAEYWPEGEGFGSSDMVPLVASMMNDAGIATEYRDGRLCRKA